MYFLSMTSVIGVEIDETSYEAATCLIQSWAKAGESRAVYATSVHGTMEAHDVPEFRNILNQADLVTPDGMPLVWMLRLKGVTHQQRVYGPSLMLHVLEMAAREKIPVGFYGGASATLEKLILRVKTIYPGILIDYALSPPFRSLTDEEIIQIRKEINSSGVRILFVGLGCPRQERWIDAQRDSILAVMIGIGAAFDFHAGLKPQAPAWIQRMSLEWLFRLLSEPRRLWKRYFYIVPRFIMLAATDLIGYRKKAS
jgi:N-acetylglucosaminyldiphosphoundecaprenol N-acetyl-beta-D-mannosaminyltransferase